MTTIALAIILAIVTTIVSTIIPVVAITMFLVIILADAEETQEMTLTESPEMILVENPETIPVRIEVLIRLCPVIPVAAKKKTYKRIVQKEDALWVVANAKRLLDESRVQC